MKNFNTISDCIQAFLSKYEINSILEEIEYKDSATITFGESKLPWAKFHGKKSGIKVYVHLDVNTYLPIRTDFKTFDSYKNNNQDFVIRMGSFNILFFRDCPGIYTYPTS